MTQQIVDYLANEHKFAGFGNTHRQFLRQVLEGKTEFVLRHMDSYPVAGSQGTLEDRVLFAVHSKATADKGYYNGFDCRIVKNFPAKWTDGNLSMRSLEIMLQSPPDRARMPNASEEAYRSALSNYRQDISSQLIAVYKHSESLFYKLAALYLPVVFPLLEPDQRPSVEQTIKDGLEGEIRQQRFFPSDRITRVEAYNLLDRQDRPRAVCKTYISDQEQEQDSAQIGTPRESTYTCWRMLDYSQAPNEYGSRRLLRLAEGFDIAESLRLFNFRFETPEQEEKLVRKLEKGGKGVVTPVHQEDGPVLYVYANPSYRTLHLQNAMGAFVAHDPHLTPEGRQVRAEKVEALEERRQANTPSPDPQQDDHEKKTIIARIRGS